jgi:putative SOS response-associated peptidase YedK
MHARAAEGMVVAPSYNVAPQSVQPVVRLNREGERELELMRWGLVPAWAKDAKIGRSTMNARAETVRTSAAFRDAFERRRCLVPASGFYEWMKLDGKNRQPYAITVKDAEVMAFAGLWDRWKDPANGEWLLTYTILTTDPNELMELIHDRMPVILAEKDYGRWIERGDPARPPVDLLRPFPAEEMRAWKVGAAVGNVKNDSPELCKRSGSESQREARRPTQARRMKASGIAERLELRGQSRCGSLRLDWVHFIP